jgi:molecular chaperone DnaK
MSVALGIDLGTSNSCAAAVRDDAVVVVEDDEGRRTMPSIVHFASTGRVVVGSRALPMVTAEPRNTIMSAKRFLGRRMNDPAVRVAQNAYLYRITEGPNNWPVIDAWGGPYAVPEICACVLRELKRRAEQFFGERIDKAVITVPANADDAQREQTRLAGRIAGLEVVGLLNEPTAAALAYSLAGASGERILVYDFGGGTFDCSVLQWAVQSAKVLATHGDTFLGGDDVDLAMALSLATKFNEREGVDLRGRTAQWRRLLLTCEEAKRRLSRTDRTTIEVPDVANTSRGVLDLAFELTRTDLEVLVEPIVRQTIDLMLDTLALAGLDIYSVDQVLLVGGSSRLPLVRSAVRQALGKTPLIDLDPDTAVAIGAAIEAHRLHGGTSPSLERLPREIVQVVPHAIGLATAGGGFDPVIPRNSPLPVIGERSYTTWREAQQEMRFVVLQGDSANAADNARLGAFVIDDLPRRPAGEVEVKLTLEVGTDGLLRASARDTFSNKVHRYRIRVSESPRGGW